MHSCCFFSHPMTHQTQTKEQSRITACALVFRFPLPVLWTSHALQMMGKLKDMGNWLLGKVGLSPDHCLRGPVPPGGGSLWVFVKHDTNTRLLEFPRVCELLLHWISRVSSERPISRQIGTKTVAPPGPWKILKSHPRSWTFPATAWRSLNNFQTTKDPTTGNLNIQFVQKPDQPWAPTAAIPHSLTQTHSLIHALHHWHLPLTLPHTYRSSWYPTALPSASVCPPMVPLPTHGAACNESNGSAKFRSLFFWQLDLGVLKLVNCCFCL